MIAQCFLFMFGIHVKEMDDNASRFYLTWMHRITNTFVKVADFILPLGNIFALCMVCAKAAEGGWR